jgi:hypothetical protein
VRQAACSARHIDGFDRISVQLGGEAQPLEGGNLRVMTQNMFIGDLEKITRATPETLAMAAAETFRDIVNTDPKQRATAIAKEIQSNRPDLVALQEVGILRRGMDNNPKIPATQVVHDQLQLLRTALAELHQDYDTVAVIPNSDAQFPSALGHTVRITDRTVILARASSNDLKLSNVQVQEYGAEPPVPGSTPRSAGAPSIFRSKTGRSGSSQRI